MDLNPATCDACRGTGRDVNTLTERHAGCPYRDLLDRGFVLARSYRDGMGRINVFEERGSCVLCGGTGLLSEACQREIAEETRAERKDWRNA